MNIVIPPDVPDGYALFYTTRQFDGRDLGAVRTVLRERFGIDAPVDHCAQVHGSMVKRAGQACDSCDALWSSDAPAALAIKVADCLPISIIDPGNGVFANIHQGWRGAVQRIVDTTLDALTPFDPGQATAWLGPTIRGCCFEVGEEVVDQFRAAYPDADAFVDRSHVRPHVDVPALTTSVLRQRGIGRVIDSGLCTRCEGSPFHSYRRDGKGSGRNLAIVARS